MKHKARHILTLCIATLMNLALTILALNEEASADIFLESQHECSASCMDMLSRNSEGAQSKEAHEIRSTGNLNRRYQELLRNFEDLNSSQPYLDFFLLEAPAIMTKGMLSLVPVGGSIASDFINKGVEYAKKSVQQDAAQLLRKGLAELENTTEGRKAFENADSGEKRLILVEDSLRKLNILTGNEKIFDVITDPDQQQEIQQSAIRLLTKGLGELRSVVVANTASIEKIKGEMKGLSKQVKALEKGQQNLKEKQAELKQKSDSIESATTDVEKEKLEAEQRRVVRDFMEISKTAANQLDAASGIFHELGAPEAARAANLASGAISLAAGIALSTVEPTAILPTVLSGIKFFKGFGGGGEGDPLMLQLSRVIELQKQILARLDEVESLIRKNHAEVMQAVTTVNHNVLLNYELLRENLQQELLFCTFLVPEQSYFPVTDPMRASYIKQNAQTRFRNYESFTRHASEAIVS